MTVSRGLKLAQSVKIRIYWRDDVLSAALTALARTGRARLQPCRRLYQLIGFSR